MSTAFGSTVNTDIVKIPFHTLRVTDGKTLNAEDWNTFILKLGAFTTSYHEFPWTGTLTGCATSPTLTINTNLMGKNCFVTIESDLTAASNSTACTVTGMPALFRPARLQTVIVPVSNAGVLKIATAHISTAGVITLSNGLSTSGAFPLVFTNDGLQKGIMSCSFMFRID